jgi:O-acetyl-ADP-ribose deacetylase (regulator of RNase III)
MYQEVTGNLIKMALEGQFDVIAHGCNCHSVMGAGLAPQMAKMFGCDQFEMELWGSTIEKLGNIDYTTFALTDVGPINLDDYEVHTHHHELIVVNAYTQYNYGKNHKDGSLRPADYEAITLCMRKMNSVFKGKHIGLPLIGAGLAGGDWEVIKNIIQTELVDCDITIVHYDGTTI